MSQEENVDTQVEEELDQNTDTDESVDEESSQEETTEESTENSTGQESTSEEPDKEVLDLLSDDEFVEYMSSGKLPADINNRTKPKEEEKTEPEEQEETKVAPNKARIISKPTTQDKGKATTHKDTDASKEQPTSTVNYEDVYKRIFAPFKANGKEITPRNVEDVISLMQMGANYTKKMQVMAPMRKIVESLSAANISEDDLSFLIDLHKGDKEAIKQLLKKNDLDITDLDLDEIKYKPNKQNIASDEDVAFAETISDINDSLPQIQEILNKTWDAESKKLLLSDPRAMRALHEEIQMGRFEKVQQRLELEKTFGRYKGVPDVQAYIDLVNRMVADEQSDVQAKQQKNTSKSTKAVPDKRKAAPTRGTQKSSSTLTAKDLFSMSDEEFERLSVKDLV